MSEKRVPTQHCAAAAQPARNKKDNVSLQCGWRSVLAGGGAARLPRKLGKWCLFLLVVWSFSQASPLGAQYAKNLIRNKDPNCRLSFVVPSGLPPRDCQEIDGEF